MVAAAVRNGAHFTNVFVAGFSIFLFYVILFSGRLIPRPLAAMVALAAISQMIGVGRPFFGGATDFRYLMPIAVLHLAGTIWLIVRGFAPRGDGV